MKNSFLQKNNSEIFSGFSVPLGFVFNSLAEVEVTFFSKDLSPIIFTGEEIENYIKNNLDHSIVAQKALNAAKRCIDPIGKRSAI